jgi:hypothetical protein
MSPRIRRTHGVRCGADGAAPSRFVATVVAWCGDCWGAIVKGEDRRCFWGRAPGEFMPDQRSGLQRVAEGRWSAGCP